MNQVNTVIHRLTEPKCNDYLNIFVLFEIAFIPYKEF